MATKIDTPIAYRDFATFSVTTDLIAPYKYQWKRDGVNLAHGNNKTYTTPPLRPEDFKAKYSVQVFGQDAIELSEEAVINDKMVFVDPITDKDFNPPVAKGTPVTKPFSANPIPPYQPAPATTAPMKPFGAK